MKTNLLLILSLLVNVPALSAESERIVVIKGHDVGSIQKLLNEGWVVKHQTASVYVEGIDARYGIRGVLVFTLSPPPPERLLENEAKRKAEFEARREEYLRKQSMPAGKIE